MKALTGDLYVLPSFGVKAGGHVVADAARVVAIQVERIAPFLSSHQRKIVFAKRRLAAAEHRAILGKGAGQLQARRFVAGVIEDVAVFVLRDDADAVLFDGPDLAGQGAAREAVVSIGPFIDPTIANPIRRCGDFGELVNPPRSGAYRAP